MEYAKKLPDRIETVEQLEDLMTEPSPDLVESFRSLEGDLLILGVGGKMGPTLARMAKRASEAAGRGGKVIGLSRFSNPRHREELEEVGVETIACDLLNREEVSRLPDCPNVVFMAGMKFGTTGAQAMTWAMNALVPSYVAERFSQSRIVVFSSGNVYPFAEVDSGGPTEDSLPEPVGEYAQSVLARERVFEYFSQIAGTPISIIRLNYAIDLRYGVLLDIANKVWSGESVDVSTGYVNVIWQGDANRQALLALSHCSSPPAVFNVTGPEILSVRKLAEDFGAQLGKPAVIQGTEAPTALLSNASKANGLFGPPRVSAEVLVKWIAEWVRSGGPALGKPTHFEVRDGNF